MQSEIISSEKVMEALVNGDDVLYIKPEILYSISGGKQIVSCISLKSQKFKDIEEILTNHDNNPQYSIFVKVTNNEEKEEEEPNYAE